ncbi:MAG: glycosyltransferase family 4 protein, partial [Vicinamibacterales bacterium]
MPVRILVDYRAALRERTGVGEFVHELVRALSSSAGPDQSDQVVLFTSSWKDRPAPGIREELSNVRIVDRRIPVRLLTWAWNRLEWPPVEWLAGACSVAHSQSPLLIPAARAAQVVTIHDLDFLRHPEHVEAEMRRDYPVLARSHARRAHAVVVSSRYAAGEVIRELGLARARVHICSPGTPSWAAQVASRQTARRGRRLLFIGTLGLRKNVGTLLEAYARLVSRVADVPPLTLAGRTTPESARWEARAKEFPLAGRVEFTGYVDAARRVDLYADARMLILPSYEEGFGLPVLEAMACGIPVVVSSRGSLPEVAGAAADPVDPDDAEGFTARMAALLDDRTAAAAAERGLQQAARYSWPL